MRLHGRPLRLALPALLLQVLVLQRATGAGPRCPPRAACQEQYNVTGDYFYTVEDKNLTVSYVEVKSFKLTCPPNVSLESSSLPRFEEPTSFALVMVVGCALPAGGFARALGALRVEPRDSLQLLAVPGSAVLTAAHLAGLRVRALKVEGAPNGTFLAAEDFVSPLPQMVDLRLSRVLLPPGALLALPVGLKLLWLAECALPALPRAALARLPALLYLELRDARLTSPPALDAAPALAKLGLEAPRLDVLVAGPALEQATLRNMNLTSIDGNCSALTQLIVVGARVLPAGGWAPCARLRELRLRGCALPAAALRGLDALQLLSATGAPAGGAAPPRDLLQHVPALRDLELSNAGLRDLPSGLFGASLRLERLQLAGNALGARALAALEPFRALRDLSLSGNPLGDLCHSGAEYISNDASPLRALRALHTLRLQRVGATRVCRDWRDAAALPDLRALDLRNNDIAELGFAETTWARGQLDLRGNPVRTVLYARADYERALAAPPSPPTATVLVDSELTCDCRVYWFARALRERPQHTPAMLAALSCAALASPAAPTLAPAPLHAIPLERLECSVPQKECVAGCACAVSGERSVLRCAGAALRALPLPPPMLPAPRAVLAAGNAIADVPRRLPPELTLVDLRDNRIAELQPETWSALLTAGRRVLLSGNPLRCGCGQRAALTLLQVHATQLDAENVTCADGRALVALAPGELCGAPLAVPLGALLGAALLLALAVLACLARPASRRWIKRFLVRHNLCLRLLLRPDREEGPAPAAAGLEGEGEASYDAFVSFSHHDDKFVTEELVPRLEGAARPRRLCLHYRDWTPGEWIPTQIAESVRRSRRTLVVLSAHFLHSSWARAEFREAHAAALRDARPRLVVLLLAPPATLPLDGELRAFLAVNTYLRRDDPRFWDKLLDALPAAAPPATAASPAPPATPAPAAPPATPAAAAPPTHLTSPCA